MTYPEPDASSPPLKDPLRLLVVDDEALFREEFCSFLSGEGYPVSPAGSVDEALVYLERERFDVLLCDNHMPKRSGESLVAEVRTRWPATIVVSVTGAASDRAARRMLEEGPFYHVMKPFRVQQIHRVLDTIRSEIDLRSRIAPRQRLSDVVEGLKRDGLEVGAVGLPSLTSHSDVRWLADDPQDPRRLAAAVESFLTDSIRPSILVELSEGWVRDRGRERVIDVVRQLRAQMEGAGPLVLGIAEGAFSQRDVLVLRECLSFPTVRFEGCGIAGHQRRAILRMLSTGPKRENPLLSALDSDEVEAGSYFLDNLVAHGLVHLRGDLYRLTKDGEKAAQAIAELETNPSVASGGSRLFTLQG